VVSAVNALIGEWPWTPRGGTRGEVLGKGRPTITLYANLRRWRRARPTASCR